MTSSKAKTALQRVKEIDKKYKSRISDHSKIVRKNSNDDSDEKSLEILRPRLNIQMPETYVEYVNNYPSDNERKLVSPIRVVNSLLESFDVHDSNSKELEGDSVTVVNEKDSQNSVEEILDQSISEIIENSNETSGKTSSLSGRGTKRSSVESERSASKEKVLNFSEFLDNYSKATGGRDESSLNDVENLESKSEKIASPASVESHEEQAIESYSQDPFESNTSPSEENESEEETIESETSAYLTPDVEIYQEDSQVLESIADNSGLVVNDRVDGLPSQRSELISKANEIEEIKITTEGQSSNSDIPLHNGTFYGQREVPLNEKIQSPDVIAHSEAEGRCEEKIHVQDKSSESNTSEPLAELEKSIISTDAADLEATKKLNKVVVELHGRTPVEEKENQVKSHQVRRERREISSAIKQYVRRLEDENSRLRIFNDRLDLPEYSVIRVIKPLPFPKIPEFILLGGHEDHDPDIAFLRSRLIDIRQWLKDQYILYNERYDLAASINRT